MERDKVIEAASLIEQLDAAFDLKKTLEAGKHRLRLYAMSDRETIDDEVKIEADRIAAAILHVAINEIAGRLIELGVTDLGTA